MENYKGTILYLIPHRDFFVQCGGVGGHIGHFIGVTGALADAGYELEVVAADTHALDPRKGIRIHTAVPRGSRFWGSLGWKMAFVKTVARIVRKRRPRFCYIRYAAGFTPLFGWLRSVIGNVPLIVEVNSLGSQSKKWLLLFDVFALRRANLVLAVSDSLKARIDHLLGPGSKDHVRVFPNAVNLRRFFVEPSGMFERASGKRYVAYVGVLKENYGLPVLIEGFRLLRRGRDDVDLVIVGDGPHSMSLKRKAEGIKGIHFTGAVPFDAVPSVMKSMDVLVYTSSPDHYYQSPIKLFEYMAARKPVLAAQTPQVEKLIEHEVHGLIYPSHDPKRLAEGIARILDDPVLGRRLGEEAYRRVEGESWDIRIKSLLQILETKGMLPHGP